MSRKPIEELTVRDIITLSRRLTTDQYLRFCNIEPVKGLQAYTTELEKQIEGMKCEQVCGSCKEIRLHTPFMDDAKYTCWYQKEEMGNFSNRTRACEHYLPVKVDNWCMKDGK